MAAKRQAARRSGKSAKRFRFQLSLSGVAGIGVVCFCLFLWMFLLGVWAGQTILFPTSTGEALKEQGKKAASVSQAVPQTILSDGKKKPVAQ